MAQKFDARQTISRDVLANLLGINGTELDDLLQAANKEFNAPLRMAATRPTADSKLNFQASEVEAADLAGKTQGPVLALVPVAVASTVDFQSAATTGATFDITFPNSTIGFFRRVAFSLSSAGVIQAVFSAEAATLGAVADPGTLFTKGSLQLGWVDLEATAATPGRFKTAGSSTNIIENKVSSTSRIHRVTNPNPQSPFLKQESGNDATTGSNATIGSVSAIGVVRLTSGSLVSVSGIPAGLSGQSLTIENQTGVAITINNDEATATAANRIYTGTGGNATMQNNSSFSFVYDSTATRWMLVGGTGSGSGSGGINYITFGTAEAGTQGWAAYADAAQATPVDGTGGSPNVTWTTSTSSPLRGNASYIFTKDAANRQGQGVAYAFTIDSADQGKVLAGSFDYTPASGTYADGDLTAYIYDVTNATVIQPAGFRLLNVATGFPVKQIFTFQTASNSTSYRLIFHVASTSASAYTVKMDNIQVGPQIVQYGAPMTDWVSYTPTGAWNTNTTYSGKWRRVGDTMQVQVKVLMSGAPNAASLTVSIPSGFTIDTTKVANPSSTRMTLGTGYLYQSSSSDTFPESLLYDTTTTVRFRNMRSDGTFVRGESSINQTQPITIASGDEITAFFEVPIVGWSSSVQMSNDTDTRVVALRVSGSTTTVGTSATDVIHPTTDIDTHGGYNASTGEYTVKVPGVYRISFSLRGSGSGVAGASVNDSITGTMVKNGSTNLLANQFRYQATVTVTPFVEGSAIVSLVAGDVIKTTVVRTATVTSFALTGASPESVYMCIDRMSGPSAIASSESVAARYNSTTSSVSTTAGTPTTTVFTSKDYDTHNSYNTSTGVYTVPVSGKYLVTGGLQINATYSAGQVSSFFVSKNGSVYSRSPVVAAASLGVVDVQGSDIVDCIAGDTITIGSSSTGTTPSIPASTVINFFTIARVGN